MKLDPLVELLVARGIVLETKCRTMDELRAQAEWQAKWIRSKLSEQKP